MFKKKKKKSIGDLLTGLEDDKIQEEND